MKWNKRKLLAHWGADCGIANVNIGTLGAEIGGAFERFNNTRSGTGFAKEYQD